MSGRTLSGWYQKAFESAEDRGPDADAPLALLGVKIAGTGILGLQKILQKNSYVRFDQRRDCKIHKRYDTKDRSCLRGLKQLLMSLEHFNLKAGRKSKKGKR